MRRPSTVAGEGGRGGLVLPLVLVLLAVLGAGVFVVNYLARTQYRRGSSYKWGLEAQAVAEGGARLAQAWIGTPQGRSALAELGRQLASSGDNRKPATHLLDLDALQQLTTGRPELELAVRLVLSGRGAVAAPMAAGVLRDPGEMEGILEIESECLAPGVLRRVRVRQPVRRQHPMPPLVTRFVLLVRESSQAARAINCLRYDSVSGVFTDAASGARSLPFVVRAAPSATEPAPRSVSCVATRDASGKPVSCAQALRAQPSPASSGWTYLGGPDSWFLQLTAGAGRATPFEEQRLLRLLPYLVPSPVLGVGFEEKLYSSGFAAGASRLPLLGRPGIRWKSPTTGEVLQDTTSLLHLCGDLDGSAPVVVQGPVFRRFLAFSKVRRAGAGPFVALVHEPDEAGFAVRRDGFHELTGQGWDAYRQLMARVVEEPYNRCFDHLVTSDEAATTDEDWQVEAGATPAVPPRLLHGLAPTPMLQLGEPGALYPQPDAEAALTPRIRLFRVNGQVRGAELFRGDPGHIEGTSAMLRGRATARYPDPRRPTVRSFAEAYIRGTADSARLELGGHTVHVTQAALVLPRLRVASGGTLLVEGDVTLEGSIEAEAGEALAIVSLTGSIRLRSPGPYHAALVAFEGQIRPPAAGGLTIKGCMACRNLDNLEEFTQNPGLKLLEYDPAMDRAEQDAFERLCRVVPTGQAERFLERR